MSCHASDTSDFINTFKAAMRRLASTVTIVCTKAGAQRYGMTATAVTSLTTEPPTLLICINTSASIHNPIVETRRFYVNVLATAHHSLVSTFSGTIKGEQRFASGQWMEDDTGLPYLYDAQASLLCSVSKSMSCGTHSIFIGSVELVRLSGMISPLIYQSGAFFKTVPIESVVAQQTNPP